MTHLNLPDRFVSAPCLCGCGGEIRVRVANFIPGHDARHHSQLQKEAALHNLQNEFAGTHTPDEIASLFAANKQDPKRVRAAIAKPADDAAKAEAAAAKKAKAEADKLAKQAERDQERKQAQEAKEQAKRDNEAKKANASVTQPDQQQVVLTDEQRAAKRAKDQELAKAARALKDANTSA